MFVNQKRFIASDAMVHMRSEEDMKIFHALDIANCRIVHSYYYYKRLVQVEDCLAPTRKKVQGLFVQEHLKSLSHVQLEISEACRNVMDITVADTKTTLVKITLKENYHSCPAMQSHAWSSSKREQGRALLKKNALLLHILLDRRHDFDTILLRKEKSKIRPLKNPDDPGSIGNLEVYFEIEYQKLLNTMLLSDPEQWSHLRSLYKDLMGGYKDLIGGDHVGPTILDAMYSS